jgi:hypothetical protein
LPGDGRNGELGRGLRPARRRRQYRQQCERE